MTYNRRKYHGRSSTIMSKRISRRCLPFFLFLLFLFSCDFNAGPPPVLVTHEFTNLEGNDVFLIKVNTNNFIVPASNTGRVYNHTLRAIIDSPIESSTERSNLPELNETQLFNADYFEDHFKDILLPGHHPYQDMFDSDPFPQKDNRSSIQGRSPSPAMLSVGSPKTFWLETTFGDRNFVERTATLMAIGEHSNIWVIPGSVNITNQRAAAVAKMFDIIYPAAVNILGYETGGGPTGDGGIDRDKKIQILIYDIGQGVGGYFWGGKDMRTFIPNVRYSNEAEMFYVDSSQVVNNFGFLPYLLIHEFQHLVNFSRKGMDYGWSSPFWYDEMMSMMAEDLIISIFQNYINSNSDSPVTMNDISFYNPISRYLMSYLRNYHEVGITEWVYLGSLSYAKACAYGAYLMRNYGGVELLRRMMSNNTVDIRSVDAALSSLNPGMDFINSLMRFGEAFVYFRQPLNANQASFNRTVSNTINGRTYTLNAVNIWASMGPRIFNLTPIEMRPHSALVHSDSSWFNVSGDLTIVMDIPRDPNVQYYFIVD